MERQTITQLAEGVLNELRKQSYAIITIKHLKQALSRFTKYAKENEEVFFSNKLADRYMFDVFEWDTAAGETPTPHITSQLRAVRMLKVFENNGCIPGRVANPKEPPQCFQNQYDMYICECIDRGLSDRTIATRSLDISDMLIFLESNGFVRLDEISISTIDEYLLKRSEEAPAAMHRILSSLRCFLRCMFSNSVIPIDLSFFIPSRSRYPTKPVQKLWTTDEISDLIELVNRADSTGKRDYAILLLVVKYGIRTGDIVNLKLSDINWDTMTLQFKQNKTSVLNVLPILDDIGWALADWIANARPEQATTNHLFTRLSAPYGGMQGIHSVLKRRMAIAGIRNDCYGKSGPHSLRHALASNMLAEQIPLAVITSVLGHSSSSSTTVYLHSDIDGLKQCAIDCPEGEEQS